MNAGENLVKMATIGEQWIAEVLEKSSARTK
jgi:hypothetical protein